MIIHMTTTTPPTSLSSLFLTIHKHLLSYGHPWAHYSGGYQDRLLGGPLGLLDLCYTVPVGMERKDYRGIVLS
jgi:hydroxyacyl-ACP dehydratase HTD2-like protein with hotdog domain